MFEFPEPGEAFEDFEILEEVGRGAFARVYRVLGREGDVPLALKLTAVPSMSDDMVKRAVREIAVLRSLKNPHVVRLHGSSIGDGYFYLLMEYLEGRQLDHAHDFDEPMQVAEALRIMLQCCIGLAEAHAKGVVHRDIKPANIWLQHDGTIKILDFGFARAWGVPWAYGKNATAARTVVGTPHYCQPEQLYTDQLTPASDVYSLATILYELLSGHCVLFPHQRVGEVVEALLDNPVAWLDAHAMREQVPITGYPGCGGLPDRLLELLACALDKEPSRRPQQAGTMASILGDILHEDLEAVEAARIHATWSGGRADFPLVPGRRRIGAGEFCDVVVAGGEVLDAHALIDWSGSPRRAQLRPAAPGANLTLGGLPVTQSVDLEPGDRFRIGNTELELVYP
jgi:serine/threonine protein kinase